MADRLTITIERNGKRVTWVGTQSTDSDFTAMAKSIGEEVQDMLEKKTDFLREVLDETTREDQDG